MSKRHQEDYSIANKELLTTQIGGITVVTKQIKASNFYNISRETIRQRCKSNNKNWKEFYIIEE